MTANGGLDWIQDAYTTSDRFPNAQYFDPTSLPQGTGLGSDPFNYIRNSVKIVMDAYDGRMTFYANDPTDPILRAYEGVFPTLFTPIDKLPADLLPHLRVPEELFNVQTRMFAPYHVQSPSVFYNRRISGRSRSTPQANRVSPPRRTTSSCGCRRKRRTSSSSSSRWCRRSGRT